MGPGVVQPSDLTARARIREAALELFTARGFAGTSIRAVAAGAGVSPALVIHHFATKEGLRQAVDDAVVAVFAAALDRGVENHAHDWSSPGDAAIAALLRENPAAREYLRRSLLERGSAGGRLFGALFEAIERGMAEMDALGRLKPDTDPVWRAYYVMFVLLGPVLLAPQIAGQLGVDAYAPEIVRARSASNLDLLQHGLYRVSRPEGQSG